MSDSKTNRHVFYAVKAQQRDFALYLTTVKGKALKGLCEGLRPPESREQPIGKDSAQIISGAKEFVEAVSTSEFATEVSKIEADSYGDDNPYQRFIDEARVKSIAAYLQEDFALVPNGVVLVVAEDVEFEVKETRNFARIILNWNGSVPLQIIDGQHRVEGLKRLLAEGRNEFGDFDLPVCLLVDLPFYLQAELFAVINGKQKPVPRSRIYDLLGYRPIEDKLLREKAYQGELAIHRFCHLVIRVLNNSQKSPWHEKVKMRGAGPGVVTQAAMVDHLASLVTPKKDSRRIATFPVLYKYFRGGDLVGLAKICVIYFLGIAKAWPDFWKSGDDLRKCLFGKTSGVAVMFMVLHDLCLLEDGPENLTVEKVESYWRKAPQERIIKPPAGGSRGFQLEWYRAIMEAMVGKDYMVKISEAVGRNRPRLLTEKALFARET
jgi:DGQHR domain-containing protein